ncbi:sugar isomerase [Tenacibaculum sp. SZ-18]|uniref:sugar isomerase n=1 Tax=Tenacibaculum sp. SZ-18 TaxID=754423 RepID=UPI000C2D29D4|nr:sugar isomerase [Tenacibaculum sp. SZ-18]AUC17082.1 sugar isomerase [Tenacibaculum sp. SZ-18]
MLSAIIVNGGNYLYNLLIGRILGPTKFADAAILITFLLVLSFIAMTFQLVTAKYTVLFDNKVFERFMLFILKRAVLFGVVVGALIVIFSKRLQEVFNTHNAIMFVVFGVSVPIYFLMSVNRGIFQGCKNFLKLAITYQTEMISRLSITLLLLYLFVEIESSILISLGIIISLVFGLLPLSRSMSFFKSGILSDKNREIVYKFLLLTAFYECTQIIINNSDILLVKTYFDNYNAGLYASLALIGRVVYFIAWMFVMLLLPSVVSKQKEGIPHKNVLLKYVGYISLLSGCIVLVTFLFPEFVVGVLFGEAYLGIASLLWQYALATSIFAVSNVFAYYFLSLDEYIPVILTGILGIAQVFLIVFFHESLNEIVIMQIIAMSILLVVQLLFFYGNTSNKTKQIES